MLYPSVRSQGQGESHMLAFGGNGCETGSIKNRKCFGRVIRVHTHDYIRDSFPFLILKVGGMRVEL